MAQGNQYDYVPGFDYNNNIQQMGMFYWDANALAYVRWQGSSTTPNVAIANFPALTTITGTLNTYVATVSAWQGPGGSAAWPVALATTSISGNVGISGSVAATLSGINYIIATPTGSQGISGNVGATQSGVWNVGINTGSQVAIASVSGNIGISGNVGATQSGVWNVGINTGAQVAIASVNGNIGISGNVGATQSGVWNVGINTGAQVAIASISGTNYIVATLSTGTNIIGGAYDVSGQLMNRRGAIVISSTSFVNITGAGYATLVAAQGSGVIIRVLSAHAMSQGYNTMALFSGSGGFGSTISATKPVAAYGGWVTPYNPHGWYETGPNSTLSIYQSIATNSGIDISWSTTT